jgi:hypothetical protein
MAWIDVAARIKFWGPDGQPATINGITVVTTYPGATTFS